MGTNLGWRCCIASLLLVLCMSVSDQAGESSDLSSDVFDTQQKCSMHCGKFPWPMFLPGIEQGTAP